MTPTSKRMVGLMLISTMLCPNMYYVFKTPYHTGLLLGKMYRLTVTNRRETLN